MDRPWPIGPTTNGTLTGYLKMGQRLYALGTVSGNQAMWRVPFDNAPDPLLVRSAPLPAADQCGLVDLPPGFSVAGKTFVDQGANAGAQVSVTLTPNAYGVTDRVAFDTSNVAPAGAATIARSSSASNNGSIAADGRCFNMGGHVIAFGWNASTGRIAWTPQFNAGTTKVVDGAMGVAGFDP